MFDTGQGRKTDPVDAHSVAVAGLRSPNLRVVAVDDASMTLRLLIDRREELGRRRGETVSRIHHLLPEIDACLIQRGSDMMPRGRPPPSTAPGRSSPS